MASANPLRIVSWNVNDLNLPEQCTVVLRELHRLRDNICFIHETHFKAHQVPKFHNRRFPLVYHSCAYRL